MNERANLGTGSQVIFKRNLMRGLRTRDGRTERLSCEQRSDFQQRLAVYLELEILRPRMRPNPVSKTGVPGPEGSIQKVFWSEWNQRLQQLAQEIFGPFGQLTDFDQGKWQYSYLRARGNTIEAGTSEIQRNIIAERVLGLPKSY